jgi:hypothetical protein
MEVSEVMDGKKKRGMGIYKPRFSTIYNLHHMTILSLWIKAQINPAIIEAMLVGISVNRAVAQRVLDTFNTLRDTDYTLDDLDIRLTTEENCAEE